MPDEPMTGWTLVDHTADIGLRVWGGTPAELFESAGRGLAHLMTDPRLVRPSESREIVLDARDLEEALISWLQEMIYRFEVERFVPAEIEVDEVRLPRVAGRIRGEAFDPARHETRLDIKAATYHALEVLRTATGEGGDRWEAVVIFDI